MARLLLILRTWGNAGAVLNARQELVRSHERTVDARVVARRVEQRDISRVAAALMPAGRAA